MRRFIFPGLILVVVVIGLLHFFTPGHLHFYHDTLRRLTYFPIVLGALWFGVQGGLVLAGLSSLAFIPHLFHYFSRGPEAYFSELTEIALYLATGVVVGVIAQRERKLRGKLERSYRRLHRETGHLLEAEEQLAAAQRLSELGRVTASLAHEIKNPLGSIRGTAEIFLDAFPPGHPNREFVEILLKETARLNSTVEKVLRYSRGRPTEENETVESLAAVLERLAALVATPLRKKGISYQVHGLESAAELMVPTHRISQVFLNLLLNAIDAAPTQGEISLTVSMVRGPEGCKVPEGCDIPEGCKITVTDNGPGVPVADRERIFDAFHTGKEEGTGLGLLISRKIVESLGGTITVADRPGGGAAFTVFLPASGTPGTPPEFMNCCK